MTVLLQCLALSSYSSSADAREDAMLRCFLSLFEASVQRVLLCDSPLKLCGRKEGQREVCPAQSQRKSAESSSKPFCNLRFSLIPSGQIQRPLDFGFGPICRRLCPNSL